MTDLDKLIAAVEAGGRSADDNIISRALGVAWPHAWDVIEYGSIDAAKRLHDALLPGWEWHLGPSNAKIYPYNGNPGKSWSGMADSPARAWLLAILNALKDGVAKP